jgi:3-oxoacyl-[acyl-carrier protein] reductase
MDLHLSGKRAMVTGSTSGIGEGIAKALAKEGATVIVHGRNREQADRVAYEINRRGNGGNAYVAIGDLSTDESSRVVITESLKLLDSIDILVNNAAVYINRGWTDTTPNQWSEIYNFNVLSAVRMVRLVIPQMKKLKWGRIIQMSTGEATQPFAFMPDYAASKAALVNITVSLSKELSQTGITVNTISPGIIVTPSVQQFYRQTASNKGWGTDCKEIEKHILREVLNNPTGLLGTIEDVANLVTFVASPLASYINGAAIQQKIDKRESQIHESHSKVYNDNLQIEIDSLEWVSEQIHMYTKIIISERMQTIVEAKIRDLERRMEKTKYIGILIHYLQRLKL